MASTCHHSTQTQEKYQQVGGEAGGGAGTWQEAWPSQGRVRGAQVGLAAWCHSNQASLLPAP